MFKISICLQCSWVPVLPQNSLSFQISLFPLHFINTYAHTAFGLLSSVHTHPFAISSFPWVTSLSILSCHSLPVALWHFTVSLKIPHLTMHIYSTKNFIPWLCLLVYLWLHYCKITQSSITYIINTQYKILRKRYEIWNLTLLCVWKLGQVRLFHPCVLVSVLFWAASTALPAYWDFLKLLPVLPHPVLSPVWHLSWPRNSLLLKEKSQEICPGTQRPEQVQCISN